MAADDRFEADLAAGLRQFLGSAEGPHPRWSEAPALRAASDQTGPKTRPIHRARLALLVAAVLATASAAGSLMAGGALRSTIEPSPTAPAVAEHGPTPTPSATSSAAGPAAPASTDSAAPPSARPSGLACETKWSFHGSADPVGLVDGIRIVEFDASDGRIVMVFGHPIDSVKAISVIQIDAPPLVDSKGKRVRMAGSVFFKLTIEGLTRPTQNVPDDIVRVGAAGMPHSSTVGGDVTEMRRVLTPQLRRPVDGPGTHATEMWIIGFDQPQCLDVRTLQMIRNGGRNASGDDTVVIGFAQADR